VTEPTTAVACAERLYAALAAGDAGTLDELLDQEFIGVTTPGLPFDLGGRYHGAEQMRDDFWWRIGKHFKASAHPERFEALADGRLQVSGRYLGSGRGSGRALDAGFVHMLSFRDGRIASLEQITDAGAWRTAAGEPVALATIDYRVDGDGLAHVVLNRPDRANAIDLQLAEDTLAVARELSADRSVRAVLIRGNGPALTVGGDIDFFTSEAEAGAYGSLLERMTTPFHQAFSLLSRLDVPILTAAHGSIAGGGLGYVYASDLCIAADNARFVTAFAGIALSGDGGGTWHLPRLVGAKRAADIYLRNPVVTADQALAWGMVNEVVPVADLEDRATTVARSLAAGPTRAYGRMRQLLRQSWTSSLDDQLAAETAGVRSTGDTADAAEGIQAFLDKRPPRFEGR
jgi:2-(1,2-epoxy-1,2-dihydrophenyl)acetyl-CoA isomerase